MPSNNGVPAGTTDETANDSLNDGLVDEAAENGPQDRPYFYCDEMALHTLKVSCETTQNCSTLWLNCICIPGMFIFAVIAFFEMAAIANRVVAHDKQYRNILDDVQTNFAPYAETAVGFFIASRFVQYKKNKAQEVLELVDREIALRRGAVV